MGKEIVLYRPCGKSTGMIGTKLCDKCWWELKAHIDEASPEIAKKIVLEQSTPDLKRFIRVIIGGWDTVNKIIRWCKAFGFLNYTSTTMLRYRPIKYLGAWCVYDSKVNKTILLKKHHIDILVSALNNGAKKSPPQIDAVGL